MVSLQVIRAILSGKQPFDASAIHAAYRASKPDHLYRITGSEFSMLITIFGALSAYSEASRLPLSSEFALSETQRAILARAPVEQFERDWSDFVIELGSDQTSLGRRTADLDRYWLMCAHLSQGRAYHYDRETHDQESGPGRMQASCDQSGSRLQTGSTHLLRAHEYYTALAQNHLDESVHYAYLRGLLNVYPLLPIVRANLANTLRRLVSNLRFHFEPRLNRLFWDILRTLAVDFTRTERQALLDALSRRLSFSISRKHVSRTQCLIHLDSDQDDWDPVLALRRAILDVPTSDEPWARVEAHWAISHNGWPLLAAIAGRPVIDNTHSPLSPRRINVLLGLRYLELEGGVIERLWRDWMTVLGAEMRRADKVDAEKIDRAILLEFLKASAIHKSDRVLAGIERLLLVESGMMLEQDRIQAATTIKSPIKSASVMLGAALVCIGTVNLATLFVRITSAGFKAEDDRFPNAYLARLVQLLLTFREPKAAWSIARQCEDGLPVELVEALAKSCAKQGLVSQAVSLLSDTRIPSETKFDVALKCLRQCLYRRVVLTRVEAVEICETLNSQMNHVPLGLRHAAVWMCLNAGLVRLAGLMGICWNLSRRMQRKLVARLVRAKLYKLALMIMDDRRGWPISGPTGWLKSRSSDRKMDATRRVNILLSRVGRRRRRRKRRGGRAQLRATLTVISRELRLSGHASPGRNRTAHRSTRHTSARLSFRPDAVTLNILCRALARCISNSASPRLRALFDRLSYVGLCGSTGNHFGTREVDGQDKFIVALAGLVRASDARVSFVRHTRPLLKAFLRGFMARGDEEAVRVLEGLLQATDRAWRSGHEDRI